MGNTVTKIEINLTVLVSGRSYEIYGINIEIFAWY